jgi:3-phenylpropionate/cinnamic acid dioxygenase small subunit
MKADPVIIFRISERNAAYARCLDELELEAWPGFFSDPCVYSITTRENHVRGRPVGIMYADSVDMLNDRILSLRKANVYEGQRYRHLLGMPSVRSREGDRIASETPFAVYRIMRDGRTDLFVTGCYVDEFRSAPAGELSLQRRIVVCDSEVFDTLVAIPL